MSFDDREIRELSVSLGRAPAAMVAEAAAAIARGSVNIKKDARSRVSDHPTWKRLEPTITFEQVGLTSTIGYEDRGQGELAGIAEFGSARHAPHPALIPAANAEGPKFLAAMAAVTAGVIAQAAAGSKSEYVTKSGRKIMASDAQIANWTRGSRR